MEVTLSTRDGFTIASTKGVLDDTAKEPFREKLHPLVGEKGTKLIVDLSGSPRVNSPGIGNMVALNADANTNGSLVVFCNIQPYVKMVVSVTKLDKFFNITSDVDTAIAWCKQQQ